MSKNKFEPSNFGVNNGIVRMYFGDGDIALEIGKHLFLFVSDDINYIDYDLEKSKITANEHLFLFKTSDGIESRYKAIAILNFIGITKALNDFVSSSLDDSHIRINSKTEELVHEIMDYHKDNLVNHYLDNGNIEELYKLSLLL